MIRFCIGLAALSVLATPALAGTTVDVDNLLVPAGSVSATSGLAATSVHTPDVSRSGFIEQTWTVGKAGWLAQVDLVGMAGSTLFEGGAYVSSLDFDVTLSILAGGGPPSAGDQVLASVTKAASDIVANGVTSFDFQALDLYAAAGAVLTWRMTVEDCPAVPYCARTWVNWNDYSASGAGTTYGYAGGDTFMAQDGVTYNRGDQDLNFRTWVSDGVPEPATWGLMTLGFLGSGLALRRRARPA